MPRPYFSTDQVNLLVESGLITTLQGESQALVIVLIGRHTIATV